MNIYFDTEFTGLHKDTTLLSIGLVSDCDKEFYAQFNDYDKKQVDSWIDKNVIHNFKSNAFTGNKIEVSNILKEYFTKFDQIQLISDVPHYDIVLLIDLFGTAFDLPSNVSPVCYDINQDIAKYFKISQKEAFNINRENFVGEYQQNKHNALHDAKIIKLIYNKINKKRNK